MMARTTLDIDTPILRDLKKIQQKEKKSLGKIVSELLADAISRRREGPPKGRPLRWRSADMRALVDIADKEAVYAALDESQK